MLVDRCKWIRRSCSDHDSIHRPSSLRHCGQSIQRVLDEQLTPRRLHHRYCCCCCNCERVIWTRHCGLIELLARARKECLCRGAEYIWRRDNHKCPFVDSILIGRRHSRGLYKGATIGVTRVWDWSGLCLRYIRFAYNVNDDHLFRETVSDS